MMIHINGKAEEITSVSQEQTVSDFITQIARYYVPKVQIITLVKVNGKTVSWERNTEKLDALSCVEILTSPAREVVISGLLKAYQLGDSLQFGLITIADGLGTQHHHRSLEALVEYTDSLQWLHAMLCGVETFLGIAYDEIYIGGKLKTSRDALKITLTNISQALQQEDFVLLSDLLRYELAPCMEDLHDVVGSLIKEADRKFLTLS